ncbi:MAG: AAA family ATPase [Propionibacteriaceae bacterium]
MGGSSAGPATRVPPPASRPRLLERDPELVALRSFWSEALSGRGRLVFLGGEAGAGKTTVAYEFARQIAGRARFLVGVCDGTATPQALGPLNDVAETLSLQSELDDPAVRRAALFSQVRTALGRSPTLLLLEDLHWADEATLDLVRYLARRLDGVPLLVVATFRDDEVVGVHPLSALLGDLATAASVSRMQLPLLTEAAVAELARDSGRELDTEDLYRRTDGNPFFVTEILAGDPERLPTTVLSAVAARAARLSDAAQCVLATTAVIGATAEIALVLAVSPQVEGAEAAAALDECVAGGMLLDERSSVGFRHALARQAILDAVPPATRVELHRRVLDWLTSAGSSDHRRLAHHANGCGDAAAVVLHAPRAAAQAARLGSHREAAEHLRTAMRHRDAMTAAQRAEVLERLSYELTLISNPVEALECRREAVAAREALGDWRQVGADQRWLSRLSWFLGRSSDAYRYARAAVTTLEPLGSSGELAMAYSNISHLSMTGGTPEEALSWGRRAFAVARAAGDREVETHALNNMGTALLRRGDWVEGRARLDQSLDIALADGFEEHASRAWCNIGALQAANRRLAEAETTFRAGIAYCADHDLESASLYMRSWLASVLLEQGKTEAGVRMADDVLRHPQLSVVSRITALLATDLAAVRTGDPASQTRVAQLHRLARDTGEPQRLLPVALVQAEEAWTGGRTAEIVALTDDVWAAYSRGWEPWVVAELAWWRRLGGATDDPGPDEPEPFALMRAGRAREASEAWTAIGRPFWAALALAAGRPADTSEAVAGLLRLGATASAQAVRRDLAQAGRPVPRGPRNHAQANAAGLTAREVEVLGCLVDGLSDAEIANRLTVSERTVGHHVSAVLRKLGVPSRSRAAAAAAQVLAPARTSATGSMAKLPSGGTSRSPT